jgi:sodium/potassium-transporting ATPase subunit alpha
MGRINKLTNSGTEERTNLQKEITRFVKIIIGLTLTLITIMLITWLAWLRVEHYDFINTVGILTNLMALVVAFIPEGVPIAVTLTLSRIATKMRDNRLLPKSLSTVETLGCVSVVCSDKTGTLTTGRMTVASIGFVDATFKPDEINPEYTAFKQLRKCMTLNNDAKFDENHELESSEATSDSMSTLKTKHRFGSKLWLGSSTPAATAEATSAHLSANDLKKPAAQKIIGNATDGALLLFTSSLSATELPFTRSYDLPFNSTNKFALTLIKANNGSVSSLQVIQS